MKKFKPLEPAPWAKAEMRRKLRKELFEEFFQKVRFVFVLLLLATILVFAHNHYVQVQEFINEQSSQLAKKATVQDKLRAHAMSHENEINQAGQSTVPASSNQTQTP